MDASNQDSVCMTMVLVVFEDTERASDLPRLPRRDSPNGSELEHPQVLLGRTGFATAPRPSCEKARWQLGLESLEETQIYKSGKSSRSNLDFPGCSASNNDRGSWLKRIVQKLITG